MADVHEEVKNYDLPNYLGAHIPINSQLNIQAWEKLLDGYWEAQLLECLKFGFPLGFNRMCPLNHDKNNHKSASEFPVHVDRYIAEEKVFGAIRSFDALFNVMTQLGLTVSEKKLVQPTTRAVCLGILIDTIEGTIAIPPEKLDTIREMVREWRGRKLQSLLGSLLYVHMYFLNRMLGTLRNASNPARVVLNDDFQRDLAWFDKFLPSYNGISLYIHKRSDTILEFDACLTGLGAFGDSMSITFPYVAASQI